jgi:hypothetical protein
VFGFNATPEEEPFIVGVPHEDCTELPKVGVILYCVPLMVIVVAPEHILLPLIEVVPVPLIVPYPLVENVTAFEWKT